MLISHAELCIFAYLCEHLVAGVISNWICIDNRPSLWSLLLCFFLEGICQHTKCHPFKSTDVWKSEIACACVAACDQFEIILFRYQQQNNARNKIKAAKFINNNYSVEIFIINKCAFNSVSSEKGNSHNSIKSTNCMCQTEIVSYPKVLPSAEYYLQHREHVFRLKLGYSRKYTFICMINKSIIVPNQTGM